MRYPTVSISDAKLALEAWRAGDHRLPKVTRVGSREPDFDEEMVDDMCRALQGIRKSLGEPGEDRRYWARFEGEAAAVVHETLEVPPSVGADHEFWLWLVFGSGYDYPAGLVTWRHGRGEAPYDARDSNYGITTSLEAGFFSRAWLRGRIGYDEGRDDPYELALRGDQDLWRSHILRTEYGQIPQVARGLLLFQYPDDHPKKPRVSTKIIREMAKELRRRQAMEAYELMDEDQVQALLNEVRGSVTE